MEKIIEKEFMDWKKLFEKSSTTAVGWKRGIMTALAVLARNNEFIELARRIENYRDSL